MSEELIYAALRTKRKWKPAFFDYLDEDGTAANDAGVLERKLAQVDGDYERANEALRLDAEVRSAITALDQLSAAVGLHVYPWTGTATRAMMLRVINEHGKRPTRNEDDE